jgi:hypothetical protein
MNPFEKFNSAPDVLDIRQWMEQQKAQQQPQQPKQPEKKGNLLTSLIPSGGGIAGAAGGAAIGTAIAPGIGTLLGALLGGAAGGAGGKVAENAVEGQQNLGQGVGQEALINGVLGAGPLRLLKGGVDVARGLKAGTGLADAVANAGQGAVNSSIRGAVGNKLTDASNDLVVKNFRLTPSQLNNFKSKFGEDASQTIKKYGLVGKDAGTIADNTIKPLQGEFDSIAQQIPSLPTVDVLKAFKAKYEPLINSAVEDKQAIGQQLKQQADTLAKKYGAEIPSGELAGVRQEFDSLVNYADKAANPARYGVNKLSADAIRSVLQQTADKAGIKASNGMTFKEVGQELSKLHQLTDNIAKQEQLGRGSSPLGLLNLVGGGVGAGVGGPLGAIGGAAVTNVANSSLGRKITAGAAEKVGAGLTKKAASSSPYGIGGVTSRILPAGVAGAYLSSPNSDVMSQMAPTTNTATSNPDNMGALYTNGQDMSSTTGSPQGESPYSQANLMADVQRDPKNADKYFAIYQNFQKTFASPTSKPLNSTQLQQANNAQSGLTALGTIQSLIQQDPSMLLKGAIPTDIGKNLAGAGVLNTARKEASDVISRLRTGAAINKEEENFYRSQLPQFGDTPDTIDYKLNLLGSLFSRFANPEAAQPDLSSGGDLVSALMSAQGGQ